MCMDTVLCFKHTRKVARDNTVKYRWRTLQLLPGIERPSYAGSNVEVIEMLDGQLVVEHHGHILSSQEAPPRPGILRSFNERSPHEFVPQIDRNGLGRRWTEALASLDAERATREAHDVAANGASGVRSGSIGSRRKPTPLQVARWRAVQKAKRRGFRFEGLLGSWVSIGSRPGSTWKLRVRPWHALEYQRGPLSLIAFRTERVTFSLNS